MVQKIIRQPTDLLQQREGKTTDLGAIDMDSEGADQPQSSSYDEPLSKKGELEESKKKISGTLLTNKHGTHQKQY